MRNIMVLLSIVIIPAVCNAQFHCQVQPTYNHNIIRHNVVNEVVVQKEYVPIAVPIAIPAIAVPTYSYTNAPGYHASLPQFGTPAPQNDDMKNLNERLDRLEKLLQALPLVQPNTSQPQVQQPPQQTPQAPKVSSNNLKEIEAKVVAIFGKHGCSSCHSGSAKAGANIKLMDNSGVLTNLDCNQSNAVYNAVFENRMPPPKANFEPLSNEDVEVIRIWNKLRSAPQW